jgi:DNA-binding SARP family transcriptional activator
MKAGASRYRSTLASGELLTVEGTPGLRVKPFAAPDEESARFADALRFELWHDLARALRPPGTVQRSSSSHDGYDLGAIVRPVERGWSLTYVLQQRASAKLIWSERKAVDPARPESTQGVARSVVLAMKAFESARLAQVPEAAPLRAWTELWTRPQTEQTNTAALAALAPLRRERDWSVQTLAANAYAQWRAAVFGWNGISRAAGFVNAHRLAERAVEADAEDADSRFVLAMVNLALGEPALAEAGLVAAAEMDPSHAPALGNLGFFRLQQADTAGTIEHCRRALAISPHEPLRSVWHGSCSLALLLQGDSAGARREAAWALNANPRHRFGWLVALAAATTEGRREQALRALDRLRAMTRGNLRGTRDVLDAALIFRASATMREKMAPVFERILSLTSTDRLASPSANVPRVRVRTLGAFHIERDGKLLESGRKAPRRPLEILKALIALGGQRVAVGTLLEALFPEEAGPRVRRRFDTALYRLRRMLGDESLVWEQGLLSLDPRGIEVDALVFERSDDPTLYRGTFLPEDRAASWSASAREALRERHQALLAQRAERAIAERRYADAVRICEKGLALDPLGERLYQLALRACALAGWRAEGTQLYERCRSSLRDELGVRPSRATESEFLSLLRG